MMTFKIFKETSPRLGIPNVMIDSLPWVYDQDPSCGFSASLTVVPAVDVSRLTQQRDELVKALLLLVDNYFLLPSHEEQVAKLVKKCGTK